MRKLTVLLAFILLTGMQVAFAQRAVTGRVVTTDNSPLPGVTVVVRGTTTGAVTDVNGGFSLQVPNNQAVLAFSFIGFVSQEVTVGTQSTVNVTLAESAEQLSEVVVTALGIRRESKSLGYSVTSVGSDVLTENRSTNAMQALEGRVSGLNISTMAAGAGGSTQIRLRGQVAFNGGTNSPLIVINGLPMDQDARSSGTGRDTNRDTGDALNNINPDDIETMTVLKGSTAAALYGSRAANGAILITTKSGAGSGQAIGVEYSSNYTSQTALDFFEFQELYGHGIGGVKPANQTVSTNNAHLMWGGLLDGTPVEIFDGSTIPYSYSPNRIKNYFRTGSTFTNTVAVSGGTNKSSFRASFSNTDTKGIEPSNEYKRNTVNASMSNEIMPNLRFNLNVNYTNEQYLNPPQGGMQGQGVMNFLTRISTVIPLENFEKGAYAPDGTEAKTSDFTSTVFNPYYARQAGQLWKNDRDRLLGTASLRYDVTDWLYVQGRYNYDFSYSLQEAKNPGGIQATVGPYNPDGSFRGSYNLRNDKATNVNADFLVGFDKTFDKISVNASFGGNTYRVNSHGLEVNATNFVLRDFFSITNGANKATTTPVRYSERRVNSLYGVAELGYNSTFYLNVTGRNDWFSVLNPANNSQFYPSVSGSVVFSELLKDQSWLNYGKLRGGWTQVGSAGSMNPYEGNLTYRIDNNPFNGQTTSSIIGNQNPNPYVTPFTVDEKEIGLEMRMFRNRLYVDVAAFEKVSDGQILSVLLSTASGYNNSRQNIGSLKNAGVEWTLEYKPVVTRNFTWTTSWNNGYLKTKVLSVGYNPDGTPIRDFIVNQPGGDTFVAQLRYVRDQELNQIYAKDFVRNAKGQIVVDKDGRLLNNSHLDYQSFGSAMPKHTGGWNNTFTYKNLTASIFFDYKFGGKVYSSTNLNLTRQGFSEKSLEGRNLLPDGTYEKGIIFPGSVYADGTVINGVDVSGQPNVTPYANLQTFTADYRNYNYGELFTYKSDFIKLRSISLSYNLTSQVSKIDFLKFVKGLTISASARNVAILYKDLPNLDPEAMQSGSDQFAGYEGLSLPTTRSFNFGLNIKF